jgi:surfeit locus 1 family protein
LSRLRVFWPALAALPVLAVLLALGNWQMQRLAWKEALLERLAANAAAPALPLPLLPEPYLKVAVVGRFDHSREARLGAEVRGGQMGATLVTPLLREVLPPLLVLRGWVPDDASGQPVRPEGVVTVEGYIRPGETPAWDSATDNPTTRRFYTFNPAAIAAALGMAGAEGFGLVALGGAVETRLPLPATHLPQPNNSHLGYALTWYGLALTLLGVVLAFTWRRWKESR